MKVGDRYEGYGVGPGRYGNNGMGTDGRLPGLFLSWEYFFKRVLPVFLSFCLSLFLSFSLSLSVTFS